MADTLDNVISKIGAVVSQDQTTTSTSDEYSLWKTYVNMAQNEWAESYDWQTLYKEFNGKTTAEGTNAQAATIALPTDFRKLAGFPKITNTGTVTNEYPQIDPQKKTMMAAGQEYCYLLRSGATTCLIVSPGTLCSGASIFVSYWKSLASLVSPADIVECPNPDYLVQRVIAMIWESREDSRFPQAKAEADKILARLLENENTQGYAYDTSITTPEQRSYSFRIGRD